MAEFIRKKRFYKYNDPKCKKFLSKDFAKQCAYCKIREGDLAGPRSFEKDHFLPITKGGTDDYENLYYACESCNGQSGKSNYWSESLLDPCRDDILGIHVIMNDNFIYEAQTDEGEEYIKAFKLNRKSYVNKRRIIASHQEDLRNKIAGYKKMFQQLISLEIGSDMQQILCETIEESEKILKYGVNYRMSINAFEEDIDDLISSSLSNIGEVAEVDKDYDLLYEIDVQNTKYLCHVESSEFDFNKSDKVKRFISTDKIKAWSCAEDVERILLIIYNKQDGQIYFVKLKEIMCLPGVKNSSRCAYYIEKDSTLENFN